jgi:large subunit ribosomal protein L21
MNYAIIRVGNKQHRVRDGETLVVDRVHTDEGGTFEPDVLLGDDGVKVTVKVVAHERGPKLRIGKYRKRTGYKRHTGFRAATSRIEIAIGDGKHTTAKQQAAKPETAKPEAARSETAPPEAEASVAVLPEGYGELTVAEISKVAKDWNHAQLEAALAYEQAHAERKGAIAALESALAKDEEEG